MKKSISLILALIMCLSLCACGGSSIETPEPTPESIPEPTNEPTPTPEPTLESTPEPITYWTTEYLVDDFGDPTDEVVIATLLSGEFSNTATTEAELKVIVALYPETNELTFGFKLLEYGDTPATYVSTDDIILKTKIGDTIKEYELTGTVPNGTLFTTGYVGWDFVNILSYSSDIRCVIQIGGSKYNFTIEREGFYDEIKPFVSN